MVGDTVYVKKDGVITPVFNYNVYYGVKFILTLDESG
jgi:hypothetical protein